VRTAFLFASLLLVFVFVTSSLGSGFRCYPESTGSFETIKTPTNGGIREDIPQKYKERYERWKAELLSTTYGAQQWESYANNKGFILTIAISDKRGQGGGTDGYFWDEDGNFVGATITLGSKIDKGFPDPIYYPVMNSLSSTENKYVISGSLLAATKIVHEIGHVNQTAKANRELLALQSTLMPEYISIFLKNGRNTRDEKLIQLAQKMGGTPVEIWESKEYWSEVTAMSFLKERISREIYSCQVFNKIHFNVEQYAKTYGSRFDEVSALRDISCKK
jgi:hypothetical protein